MSEDQLKAFWEAVQADTSLQEKLKAAATPEAVLEIAKDAGFSFPAEDIQSIQSMQLPELLDVELETAAGGNEFFRWIAGRCGGLPYGCEKTITDHEGCA